MSTQGERQNYQWRPNDNSAQTRIRYDLEMNHWLKALNANSALTKTSGGGSSGFVVIGLLISFILTAIWVILVSISDLIVWIVNQFNKPKPTPEPWRPTPLNNDEELNRLWREATPVDVEEENSQ